MEIRAVEIHSDFPEKVWVIVEQPCDEEYRMAYDAKENKFVRTEYKSLLYERGFRGAYGWIGGLGMPPERHYDIFLITKKKHQVGDIVLGHICGIFFRNDGDHKLIALDEAWSRRVAQVDINVPDEESIKDLKNVYPQIGKNEGWYGVQEAHVYLERARSNLRYRSTGE